LSQVFLRQISLSRHRGCAPPPTEHLSMESFSLPLANEAILAGLRTPAPSDTPPKDTPLIVAIHGGSYSASYYDATPQHSGASYSTFLRVPFLAIDRPGYRGSTAVRSPIPEDSSYLQEEGKYFHHQVLPAIWNAYGADYGVSSIVVLAHSLSVPMAIVAAALHANNATTTKEQAYPLAGIILSGYGTSMNHDTMSRMQPFFKLQGDRLQIPAEIKDEVMLNKSIPGLTDPEIFEKTEELNTDLGLAELVDSNEDTWGVWRHRYMPFVRCPVLYNLAGEDNLWKVNAERLRDFVALFDKSVRVESGIVPGAAHCMELSRCSRGWYARVFGWAVECGVGHGLGKF
ncbi:MAG: hypothetical protein L6R37_001250, partial [Teloschistes peruensis]